MTCNISNNRPSLPHIFPELFFGIEEAGNSVDLSSLWTFSVFVLRNFSLWILEDLYVGTIGKIPIFLAPGISKLDHILWFPCGLPYITLEFSNYFFTENHFFLFLPYIFPFLIYSTSFPHFQPCTFGNINFNDFQFIFLAYTLFTVYLLHFSQVYLFFLP